MKKAELLDLISSMAQQAQAIYSDNSFAPAHRALAAERVGVLTTVMMAVKQLEEPKMEEKTNGPV